DVRIHPFHFGDDALERHLLLAVVFSGEGVMRKNRNTNCENRNRETKNLRFHEDSPLKRLSDIISAFPDPPCGARPWGYPGRNIPGFPARPSNVASTR